MALPDSLPTVTLTGTYTHPDGSPMKGSVSITPVPGKVVSAATGYTVQGRAKAKLDANGAVTLTVLATDAAGINPTGFTYRIVIAFPDATGDEFFTELPASAPNVRLPAITPASADEGDYVVITGPEGPAGTDGEPGPQGEPGPPGSNADAEQYTDNALAAEVTRSDSAYDPAGAAATARTAAISAAAVDATTKADAARIAAVNAAATDAASKASAAQAAAISAAAADATTKAGNAQTAAVAAASSDASTKASAAQAAAIATAATDATTKADSARTAAISTASSDASTKASAAQAAAISAAAGDATTKAGTAQTAAIAAAATDALGKYEPNAAVTVANLLATNPAYFGHRGQGMVSPEHTMAGYRAAVAAGAKAIEVSVNVAADGTLVCCHDTTLDRTTYSTGAVNTWNWTELKNRVLTNGRVLHGQGWTDQPIPTLREVLDEFLGRVVIFLEAKGNDAVVPLQTMLDTFYPTASKSVVWKAHIGTASLPWAKDPTRNYRTWIYLDDGTTDAAITAKDQYIDYLGVQTSMADARVTQIVARGKPVFSWPVYRRSQRDRLAGLGVVGMMTSDIQYVSRSTPMRTASRWDNQVKEPGGVPTLDYDATYALKFDDSPNAGWVYINAAGQSYGLGTYCPIAAGAGGYRIAFDMRFEGIPALTTEHAGVYFGKASDDAYRFGTANATGGYHVVMRANGQLQLNRHTAGVTTGTTIGGIQPTDAVVANQAMSFQIDVTPTTVELRRTDGTGWTTGPIADTTYRGGYFGLSNGGITNLATKPHWRNLVITQL
ncbi:glycerophosphodiester phosphodiesterase [Streptomyces poriferorum]|uniref:Glycerophosphodiester phosphodiesterase n=1 Tax=Streptomyces poriferorum TaxID=2798799 RepID=A0ABY9J2M0_9ACTN|nr:MULTISPECIES: glycerophosphodiester phosphodiesterase [unclassified Streptomyces]MDP5310398.1 glycerophosphodiester phosphodiesterase [Streptomyces sp. Alt4]WLQ60448.1 glycerophosphodiester phosphodiesterase [Streptomyces sp. Alt2]